MILSTKLTIHGSSTGSKNVIDNSASKCRQRAIFILAKYTLKQLKLVYLFAASARYFIIFVSRQSNIEGDKITLKQYRY